MVVLLLLLALQVPDAQQVVGKPQGTPLAGKQLARRTHEVASLIRCPVCQGMSVADSPSEMAVNMKEQVRELLARGYTEDQIQRYFEISYGDFVLLKPQSIWVWALPIIALVIGGTLVVLKIRKLTQAPAASPQPRAPEPTDDPYISRVRDLVNGGKP